jgi:glycosyltransferase involved in cell wall biosynthesis
MSQGVSPGLIVTVSPGVDTDVFRPSPSLSRTQPLVAISVGELRADKGVLDVIAGADAAIGRLPKEFRLVLVGDGPLRSSVERLAESRPWLDVLGRIPRDSVADQLRAADVFILTPHSRPFWVEQLGFAVIEAMACGLPVVVTNCGALSEVVPDHNPVVPEGDVDAIANGLIAAFGPEGDDWGPRNLHAVKERYTLKTQGERLDLALTEVLHRQK